MRPLMQLQCVFIHGLRCPTPSPIINNMNTKQSTHHLNIDFINWAIGLVTVQSFWYLLELNLENVCFESQLSWCELSPSVKQTYIQSCTCNLAISKLLERRQSSLAQILIAFFLHSLGLEDRRYNLRISGLQSRSFNNKMHTKVIKCIKFYFAEKPDLKIIFKQQYMNKQTKKSLCIKTIRDRS